VLHTGPRVFRLTDRVLAVPILRALGMTTGTSADATWLRF
jgi:hypothetical protein